MTPADTLLVGLGALLGFLVGFSVGQGSTCAVTAGKQVVFEGRFRLLAGFLVASGAAGMVCLPLAWSLGMRAGLPPETAVAGSLVAGAALLAMGALVNDACLFGTLARIALGEVRFLGVPVGLAIGYWAAAATGIGRAHVTPNLFGHPSPAGIGLVVVSALLVLGAFVGLARAGDRGAPGRWSLRTAMVVLGGSGALLFVLTPGWTYADAIRRAVQAGTERAPMANVAPALLAGTATLSGAIIAGVIARSFRLQWPTGPLLGRSVAGGALMAAGAVLVPGGNDNLLLWSVPGASVSGLVAYVAMTALIIAALVAQRWMGRRRTGRV